MDSFNIVAYKAEYFDDLFEMNQLLLTNMNTKDLEDLLNEWTKLDKVKIFMAQVNTENIGYAIVSIKSDYVEGAKQSPTGYLEGIFVKETHRKKGVAKALVKEGEKWCKSSGCHQMGSDTWVSHNDSRAFHKKIGFWEEDVLVHFLKDI